MIMRSKICLRRRGGNLSTFFDSVIVPTTATTTTNEPLHFLYPPSVGAVLFRGGQIPAFRASFSSSSSSRCLKCRKKFVHSLSQPDRSAGAISHHRWFSQDRYTSQNNIAHRDDSFSEPVQGGVPDPLNGDGRGSVDPFRNSSQLHIEKESGNSYTDTFLDSSTYNNESPIEEKFTIRRTFSDAPSPTERRRIPAERKQTERPIIGVSREDIHKLRYRKYIYSRHRSVDPTAPPHWTELMAQLEKIMNEIPVEQKKDKHKELLVREETVAYLSGSTDSSENVWYVRIRNGCRIHVLDTIESEGIYRRVILSGTLRAIELVERQFRQVDELQRRSKLAPVIPSILALNENGITPPLVRGVWTDSVYRKDELSISSSDFKTKASSIRDFTHSVLQLIQFTIMRQSPNSSDRWSPDKVKDLLLTMFTLPENYPFLSAHVLNLALDFLCEHEFLSSARIVSRKSHTVATVETYNTLLRSTAKRQDVWFFKAVLSDMEQSRTQPDGKTWVALLECLVSQGPRSQVMRRMEELGLLQDRRVLLDVMEHQIPTMISSHIEKGLDIQSFIASLEQTYGRHIITTRTLNQILSPISQVQNPMLLREALKCFEQFEVTFNSMTFDLAFSCFPHYIAMLKVMCSYLSNDHILTERHYEQLFLKALNSKAYNSCRVIWRYACMRDATSPLMRQIVRISLAGRNMGRLNEPGHINYHIGAIVAGLEYRRGIQSSGRASSMVPEQYADNPVIYLVLNKAEMSDQEKMKLARQLIMDDVAQGTRYQSVLSFSLMLEAALKVDQEMRWHSYDRANPGIRMLPTVDILKHVVDVPIE